jgi:hypothetical protein
MPPKLPRFRAEQKVADLRRVERIVAEVERDDRPLPVGDAGGGSPRSLRGVPVVGVPGAGGTSPGTDPVRALIAKDGQRRRK